MPSICFSSYSRHGVWERYLLARLEVDTARELQYARLVVGRQVSEGGGLLQSAVLIEHCSRIDGGKRGVVEDVVGFASDLEENTFFDWEVLGYGHIKSVSTRAASEVVSCDAGSVGARDLAVGRQDEDAGVEELTDRTLALGEYRVGGYDCASAIAAPGEIDAARGQSGTARMRRLRRTHQRCTADELSNT